MWQNNAASPFNRYICTNANRSAAVWKSITAGGGGGGGSDISAGALQVVYGDGEGNGVGDAGILVASGEGLQVANTYTYAAATLGGFFASWGVDSSNTLTISGTDSGGSPLVLMAAAMDSSTPSATWHVPVATTGSRGAFVMNDRDGRDPAWTMYANTGDTFLDSGSNPGVHALSITPSGEVTFGTTVASLTALGFFPQSATQDFGTGSTRWRNGYFSGTVEADVLVTDSGTCTGLIEQIPGLIESPVAKTYIIILGNVVPLSVVSIAIQTVSGTCTASLNINGSPIGGAGPISVTASPQTITGLSGSMGAGDKLTLVISAPSSPQDLAFTIQTTRS